MKTFSILSLGLAFTFSTRAALVTFQLSPPGSDQAAGLSPSNQVPPAVGSSGSGGDISGGIVYDPSNSVLEVAVGYGSSAGFSNLTGPVIAIDIHGPAGPGTNTNILVNLLPYNFTAANLTNGGVIFGDLL